MNLSLIPALIFCGAVLASAQAQEKFRVYAPSPTSGKLLIVEATPTQDALALKLGEEVKLGFPVATIAKHPTQPLLYLAPASGEEGKAKGAIVSLHGNGSYQKHSAFLF